MHYRTPSYSSSYSGRFWYLPDHLLLSSLDFTLLANPLNAHSSSAISNWIEATMVASPSLNHLVPVAGMTGCLLSSSSQTNSTYESVITIAGGTQTALNCRKSITTSSKVSSSGMPIKNTSVLSFSMDRPLFYSTI